MIKLKRFQQSAADQIADRFGTYMADPVEAGTKKTRRTIPFVQMLASITASGKTVVLADAVATIATELPVKPVILWLSKGKVVVEQSLANLQGGGKYHHLIQNCAVQTLAEFDLDSLTNDGRAHIYFATVGTFNHSDRTTSTLNIYKSDVDTTDQATWDKLKQRTAPDGSTRPLIVVYDEAHNLSDQQTDILFGLAPAAFLLASASMKLPARMGAELEILKAEKEWSDSDLITEVVAKDVADSGLVKTTVQLIGYNTPMEEAVSGLIADMRAATADAAAVGMEGRPKAIYVCNTNMLSGNAMQSDNHKRPFYDRQAPPILIWRYLTEQMDIDPRDIAVYCSLKVDKSHPLPDSFQLFSGGEKDYEQFTDGDFHHVIFNLSLQEGWDDPLCYFAYIDKSMESRVQVEQVVGRLLRQPGVKHYNTDRLNTAHLYVRVDKNKVFETIVDEVQDKLNSDAPAIRVVKVAPGSERPVEYPVLRHRCLPEVALNAEATAKPIAELLRSLHDYRPDLVNTVAEGRRVLVTRRVGERNNAAPEWEEFEHSCTVLARWIFIRTIKSLFPAAVGAPATDDPRFDAVIGLGSAADTAIRTLAHQVVDTYLQHTEVEQSPVDGDPIGPMMARPKEVKNYVNALHGGYAGLSTYEESFANALDAVKCDWYRNPSQTGFRIPLVTLGRTRNFFPDFVVWHMGQVFAVDTKGEHLIVEDAQRKLFGISNADTIEPLHVRLVSEGRWSPERTRLDASGFTLWRWNSTHGKLAVTHTEDLTGLVAEMLKV